jgi:hypothetical protein
MEQLPPIYLKHVMQGSSTKYKNTDKTIIRTVLEDGFMRNANTTKNSKLTGRIEYSDYDKDAGEFIYFEMNLESKKPLMTTFILDSELLLEQPFMLIVGWTGGGGNGIKINPKKINKSVLHNLLVDFRKKFMKENENNFIPGLKNLMTHEIVLKKPVDLHKYLLAIKKSSLNNQDLQYVKENYPNVKLI